MYNFYFNVFKIYINVKISKNVISNKENIIDTYKIILYDIIN